MKVEPAGLILSEVEGEGGGVARLAEQELVTSTPLRGTNLIYRKYGNPQKLIGSTNL